MTYIYSNFRALDWRHFAFSCAVFLAALTSSFPAFANNRAQIDALMEVMQFDDVIEILVEEGRTMPEGESEQLFDIPTSEFKKLLSNLYTETALQEAFRAEFSVALEGRDLAAMQSFYQSDLGQKISRTELETRRLFAEDGMQQAAGDVWAALDPDDLRAQLIDEYVLVGDVIELNIIGAMNADIAYFRGMADFNMQSSAENLFTTLSEGEMLQTIWAAEPEIRADVSEWVYGFSVMAYSDLSDDELQSYITFLKTDAGQALNRALFATFDVVFEGISQDLGAGTAQLMTQNFGQAL